jgi:signal transduction histidine kinase
VNLTWTNVGEAILWSSLAALVMWLVLTPLRRRSYRWLLAALVLTGAAASTGALLGAAHTMLISDLDGSTFAVLVLISVGAAAVAAIAAGRRLTADSAALRVSVAEFADGRIPSADGRKLTAEVERVREELRTTAERLATAREREQVLESARRELVAWVSHDLRTPLAGLRAMAEALEDGVVEDPDRYYKQIVAAVDRLNRMVEDLFDLSRIQAGNVARENEQIALGDIVSDCVAALEPLAIAQGVRLSGSVEGAVTVYGNGRDLNRAVTNLVANALRYTGYGSTVEVRVSASEGTAVVSVRDECGGIPDDHIDRLFDVGFRGEAARTPGDSIYPAGAGLGLTITRGIVEAHHGSVAVTNQANGCEFRITVPVHRAVLTNS